MSVANDAAELHWLKNYNANSLLGMLASMPVLVETVESGLIVVLPSVDTRATEMIVRVMRPVMSRAGEYDYQRYWYCDVLSIDHSVWVYGSVIRIREAELRRSESVDDEW